MNASLGEKLENVKWGEYRIGDLFERIKTNKLPYKADELPERRQGQYVLPCLTSSFNNQGLNYYAPREGATVLRHVISIPSNSDVYRAYYQSREFTVLSDAYAIQWKANDIITANQYLFIVMCINKVTDLPIYSYKNKLGGWNVVKNKHIKLPQNSNGIDFGFMDSFIAELEAERVAELSAYLKVTGLDNYELSQDEERALAEYEKTTFKTYRLTDVFNVKNTYNILSRDIVENSGTVPYLCSSTENNAVSTYISYDEKYLEKGNCIFIGGKTFSISYQEKDFYSNDSHNLALYLKNSNAKTKKIQLYLAACIYKSLAHKYSWGDSVSNSKIQTDELSMPEKDGKPDYKAMELLISAIQKLIIKDVVSYANGYFEAAGKYR